MAVIYHFDFPTVKSQLWYDSIHFNPHHRNLYWMFVNCHSVRNANIESVQGSGLLETIFKEYHNYSQNSVSHCEYYHKELDISPAH